MPETFIARQPPDEPGALNEYLFRVFRDISSNVREIVDGRIIEVRHVAPDKPRNAMVVYADGTDWNPGSGEGLYAYVAGVWEPFGVAGGGGFISETLFDANTILKADTDDTPVALTVPEQRLVGRITAGVITALTGAQVRTLINVEDGSTADQSGSEIKSLYEVEASAFTDAQFTKLGNIEALADVTDAGNVGAVATLDADYSANSIRYKNNASAMATLAVVTNSFLARQTGEITDIAVGASEFVGRASTGNIRNLTGAESRTILGVEAGANNYSHPNHTGDVTSVGDGAQTIVSNAVTTGKILDENVTLAKLVHIATASFLGRNTGGTGDPEVLSKATSLSILNVADGAEVNPDVVPQAEAEAGTATTERIWTAQRVQQAIAALETAGGDFAANDALLFYMASAPTGWTQITTHNDKALRVVSGTGAGSGGTVAFETAFASQAVAGTNTGTAISTAQLAVHLHGISGFSAGIGTAIAINTANTARSGNTNNQGSGSTHTHTFNGTAIDLDVSYINIIIADKD